MSLKLYVWENVLTDYTDGVMFALAESAEAAREVIIKKFTEASGYTSPSLLRDIRQEPDAYDEPIGFAVWGGG